MITSSQTSRAQMREFPRFHGINLQDSPAEKTRIMAHCLFIETQQLVICLLSDDCMTQTGQAQTRNNIVQHVLRCKATCTAEFGRRWNTVLEDTTTKCCQLHRVHHWLCFHRVWHKNTRVLKK